jgi:hypothetical protein
MEGERLDDIDNMCRAIFILRHDHDTMAQSSYLWILRKSRGDSILPPSGLKLDRIVEEIGDRFEKKIAVATHGRCAGASLRK